MHSFTIVFGIFVSGLVPSVNSGRSGFLIRIMAQAVTDGALGTTQLTTEPVLAAITIAACANACPATLAAELLVAGVKF